jgi:hypothetical protein
MTPPCLCGGHDGGGAERRRRCSEGRGGSLAPARLFCFRVVQTNECTHERTSVATTFFAEELPHLHMNLHSLS